MRFLVDTSSDARLARYLHRQGFDATRVGWDDPQNLTDEAVRTKRVDISLRIARLEAVLEEHGSRLGRFFVVTEHDIRIRGA